MTSKPVPAPVTDPPPPGASPGGAVAVTPAACAGRRGGGRRTGRRRTPAAAWSAPRGLLAVGAVSVLLAGCSPGGGGASSSPSPSATADAARGNAAPAPSAPAPESGTLVLTDFGRDTVTFVDPARQGTAADLASVRVGTAPYGIALGEDGRAWVATAEGVAVVDTATRERVALIPYDTAAGPTVTGEYRGGGMGIALSPDGRRAYVGVNVPGAPGVLEVIDTEELSVVETVPVGRRPFDVDVSPDGRSVYATNHDSFDVTVVDTATWKPRRIEVAPYGTEGGLGSWLKPHYAVVRPSDGALLLPFEGERLVVADPTTGRTRVEPMTANTHQHGAAVAEDGTLYVVGTGPIDPSVDDGPSLTIRSPQGEERIVPLNGPHEDVALSDDGRTAYVSGGFTRDGYWNGLSVVDTASGEVTRLAVGNRPLGIAVL